MSKKQKSTPVNDPLPLIAPMLATASPRLPSNTNEFALEVKWDGIRAIMYVERNKAKIISRNGFDISFRYPELQALAESLGEQRIILDGEITAFADGSPSFSRLQKRMNLDRPELINEAVRDVPITYVIFDVLQVGDRSLLIETYESRRRVLNDLKLTGDAWIVPPYQTNNAEEFLAASRKLGLEGIILKRLHSTYLPGKRSGDWLKVKNFLRQEFVIGGWTSGEGTRRGKIGALLLGYYDVTPDEATKRGIEQSLIYAGSCGTGFTAKTLADLAEQLLPITTDTNPFSTNPRKSGTNYTAPKLVGEFTFTEWTPALTLRHPSFKGLRFDKDARQVVRE